LNMRVWHAERFWLEESQVRGCIHEGSRAQRPRAQRLHMRLTWAPSRQALLYVTARCPQQRSVVAPSPATDWRQDDHSAVHALMLRLQVAGHAASTGLPACMAQKVSLPRDLHAHVRVSAAQPLLLARQRQRFPRGGGRSAPGRCPHQSAVTQGPHGLERAFWRRAARRTGLRSYCGCVSARSMAGRPVTNHQQSLHAAGWESMRHVVFGGVELGHRLLCDQFAVVLVPVLSSQPAASPSAASVSQCTDAAIWACAAPDSGGTR